MTWDQVLLYSVAGVAVVCIVLLILISIRISNHINRMDKVSKNRMVDYIRKTSKHNKEPRKKLKF
jgi:Na+-transporting methylmalonyl-CoA/oxaloacetate decarboxylase gamma subunit